MGLRVVFAEELEGAFRLGPSAREARMRLRLGGQAALGALLRGEPVSLDGEVAADGFVAQSRVAGEVRLERSRAELAYSLAVDGPGGAALRGTKRCLLADPYAGLTTLALELVRDGSVIGHATLRFDPRGPGRRGLAGVKLQWV